MIDDTYGDDLPFQARESAKLSFAINHGSPRARQDFRRFLVALAALAALVFVTLGVVAFLGR